MELPILLLTTFRRILSCERLSHTVFPGGPAPSGLQKVSQIPFPEVTLVGLVLSSPPDALCVSPHALPLGEHTPHPPCWSLWGPYNMPGGSTSTGVATIIPVLKLGKCDLAKRKLKPKQGPNSKLMWLVGEELGRECMPRNLQAVVAPVLHPGSDNWAVSQCKGECWALLSGGSQVV